MLRYRNSSLPPWQLDHSMSRLGIKTGRACPPHDERALPRPDCAIYVRGAARKGQHSLSLGNVIAITSAGKRAPASRSMRTGKVADRFSLMQFAGADLLAVGPA